MSAVSTAAMESSRSMIVETAASISRSLTPAGSSLPIGSVGVDLDLDVQPVMDQQDALGTCAGSPR